MNIPITYNVNMNWIKHDELFLTLLLLLKLRVLVFLSDALCLSISAVSGFPLPLPDWHCDQWAIKRDNITGLCLPSPTGCFYAKLWMSIHLEGARHNQGWELDQLRLRLVCYCNHGHSSMGEWHGCLCANENIIDCSKMYRGVVIGRSPRTKTWLKI